MCLTQIRAQKNPEGGRPTFDKEGDLLLPCGKCSECRSLYAFDWATRCRHEISMHNENSFITLTYDNDHLPSHILLKAPFQRFIHELRRRIKKKVKYMVSHEYGSQTFRPHHHSIVFGYNPPDQKFIRYTKSGFPLFTSSELTKLWPHGFHSIGQANEKTAYYIADYALKGKKHKITLPQGEIVEVSDDFDSSRRPGIGRDYFLRNYRQLIASGERLPRYYLKLLEKIDQELFRATQDNQCFGYKNRTAQERYAKQIITQAKEELADTEFRYRELSHQEKFRTTILKNNIPLEN